MLSTNLRNRIKLCDDVLSLKSTNFCRLMHIIYPEDWNNDGTLDYSFPCSKCPLRGDNWCSMARYDLKVR